LPCARSGHRFSGMLPEACLLFLPHCPGAKRCGPVSMAPACSWPGALVRRSCDAPGHQATSRGEGYALAARTRRRQLLGGDYCVLRAASRPYQAAAPAAPTGRFASL
jgi:hypothetical protein